MPKLQYFDEMINIMKFDGKLVEWWGKLSSEPITIIFRDATVFREEFLAQKRFCCCEKHGIKEEYLLEDLNKYH